MSGTELVLRGQRQGLAGTGDGFDSFGRTFEGTSRLAPCGHSARQRGLKRRESELAVPQPRWLREIEASIPLGEFELGAGRPVLEAPVSGRPGPPDVGAVARNQPEQVAAQVNQWLQEA